jgi:hypothetical protein
MLNTILLVCEYGKHAQCAAGTVESQGSLHGHLPVHTHPCMLHAHAVRPFNERHAVFTLAGAPLP